MKKINNKTKTKWKYGVLAIVFSLAFVAPGVFQFVDFGTVDKNQPISWFDPRLSDFFYDDTIDETLYPFNAYNESYIVCKIQNAAYSNFTLDGTIYNVSYGMNYIPIDFGNENKSYTVTFDSDDISADVYDWFSVQPVIIDLGLLEINPTTPTDIIFNSTGLISFFITWNCTSFNNFTYDELYVEYDGIVINEIRGDWTHDPEIDPNFISYSMFEGMYIQYDIFTNPGEHTIKLKGNSTVEYIIAVSGDWDEDGIDNAEEIQKYSENYIYDIFSPMIWGYYEKGGGYKLISDPESEYGLYQFFIPESYSETQYFRMKLISGKIKSVIIDDDEITFANQTFESPETIYYGKLGTGSHTVYYKYDKSYMIGILMYINGSIIPRLDLKGISDSDSDGLIDEQEETYGTDENNYDSDFDLLPDGIDQSPTTSLELDNSKITEIVIPHNESRETIVRLSIKKIEDDYTTNGTMLWKDMRVSILPMMRVFGNSSISSFELKTTYNKSIESYDITDTNPVYGDALPNSDDLEEEGPYKLIVPEIAGEAISFELIYNIQNDAKDDSNIILRFDFVWVVLDHEANLTNVVHFYEIEEPILVQYIFVIETDEVYYILGSPDTMIESEILWNLNQNPSLGSFSDFGVSDEVVASGMANFSELFDELDSVRDSNPISVDEEGNPDESEVVYFSYLFSNYDMLRNIMDTFQWTSLSENQEKRCKYESYVSSFILTTSWSDSPSEEQNRESDLKTCYIREFGNYSKTQSSLEERYDILDYPIYMNNLSFQDGNVLEITSASGSGIPLNYLPETIESTIYDKIAFTNVTIIENKEYDLIQEIREILNFNPEYDIEKRTNDNRIFEVPLSDLVFNEYSISYIDQLIYCLDSLDTEDVERFYIETVWNTLMPQGSYRFLLAGIFGLVSPAIIRTSMSFWVSMIKTWNVLSSVQGQIAYLTDFDMSSTTGFQYSMRQIFGYSTDSLMSDMMETILDSGVDFSALDRYPGLDPAIFSPDELFFTQISYRDALELIVYDRLSMRADFFRQTGWRYDNSFKALLDRAGIEYQPRAMSFDVFELPVGDAQIEQTVALVMATYDGAIEFLQTLHDPELPLIRAKGIIIRELLEEIRTFNSEELQGLISLLNGIRANPDFVGTQITSFGISDEDVSNALRWAEKRVAKLKLAKIKIREFRRYLWRASGKNIATDEPNFGKTKAFKIFVNNLLPTKRAYILKEMVTPIISIFLSVLFIWSAFTDFEEAEKYLSGGEFKEYRFRQISGTFKMIMAWAMIIAATPKLVVGCFRLIKPTTQTLKVMKAVIFAEWFFKWVGAFVQVLGMFLDLIYLDYMLDKIQSSDMTDFEKIIWSTIFWALTVAELAISIYMLAGVILDFAVAAWVPYLNVLLMLIGFLVLIFWPQGQPDSVDLNPSNISIVLPMDNVSLNGGLEIGDTIGFTIDIENVGDLTTYMQSKIDVVESGYGDWDGDWSSGYGYLDIDTINPNQTITTTGNCLNLTVHTMIAVWSDGQKKTVVNEESHLALPIPVLDKDISDFNNSLIWDPIGKNLRSYSDVMIDFKRYKDSYRHNETAEAARKLSDQLGEDFLSDTPDEMPGGWTNTPWEEGEFTGILRPNVDVNLPDHYYSKTEPTIYDCVDDDVIYPGYPNELDGDHMYWDPGHDDYFVLGIDDITSYGGVEIGKVKQVKMHLLYECSGGEYWIRWRYNDSASWSSVWDLYSARENPTWDTYTWEANWFFDDPEIRFDLDYMYLDHIWFYAIYLEIIYEDANLDSMDYHSEIIEEYKGHKNVANVTAYGEYTRNFFWKSFMIDTGTTDFWLCKDEYAGFYFDKFFRINQEGSILSWEPEGHELSEVIRERPIMIDEWTHFRVDYTSTTFDLYVNGVQCADDQERVDSDIVTMMFDVYNLYDREDPMKTNISCVYIDAIDWNPENFNDWSSYRWDYSEANITYYENIRDNLKINTSIATDLRRNVVEMSTSTHIADFDFYFDLVGTENPVIDIELFNIPDGFSFTETSFEQNLQSEVSFDVENIDGFQYAGTHFFEMNVTLNGDSEIIYHEIIPFIIPYVEDLSFEQQNVIYEENDVSSDEYTATYSFTGDTEDPDGWVLAGDEPQVVSGNGEHNDVVQFWNEWVSYNTMYKDIGTITTNGTIELWLNKSSEDVGGEGANSDSAFYIFVEDGVPGQGMWIRIDYMNDGKICAYYSGAYREVYEGWKDDVWNHLRFDFDLYSDTFDIYLNGILVGDSIPFSAAIPSFDTIYFITSVGNPNGNFYVDAIGHTWDPDYNIGDNFRETDTLIEDIAESQVTKGDLVNVEFRTNTYAEVQMKFVNNDVVQETYTILPRGNQYSGVQSKSFIINESITFDEIQFTEFKYNYFDILQILITDSLGSVGALFNPVNITNDGNAPEYIQFGISGVDSEDLYATSSPGTVEQVDREFGDADWTTVNEAKSQNNDWAESEIVTGGGSYVVSVEHVELTLNGVTSNSVTLSNDQVLANCVPFVSQKMNTFGDDWDENMIDVYFESSPSKRVTGQRGEGSGTVTLSIYIVEFDGVGVEVQSGTFSTATTYDDVDINAITQSKAFPIAYWKITGNDDDWDCAMVTTDFVDDDTIRMERDESRGAISGHWYVVESQGSEFSVQKAEMSMSTSETSKSASISSIDMSKSFVIGSWENDLSSHSVQYASLSIYLSSSTQVTAIRNAYFYSNSIPTINVFVVTFTGDESVQRGSFTFGNSDTTKSTDIGTAVNLDNSMIKAGSMYGIMECDGTSNDDPEDSFIQYEFVDTNTVRGERMGSTGEDGVGYWEVIEWIVGGGGGGGSSESDILRCTNFSFADSVPKDAGITGVVVEIDKHAGEATSIKDYSIRLRKPNGVNSSNKKSSEYWSTTDAYKVYGSLNDTWGLKLTYNDIVNPNFGIDIVVENKGATGVAYIDHVQIKIYYSKSFAVEILPGKTVEMNFTTVVPIESINNIIDRGVSYQHLGSEITYRYNDNFEIDGIYIASPLDMMYNLYGNSLSCDGDEFSLEIIPEVVLSSMNYSLDGAAQVSFSGNSADVPLPETEGNHTIQVFGEGSGPTYYESEIRNFMIQYPIGIEKPNETENTIFHEFLRDGDSFSSNDINTEPDDWTVVDPDIEDTIYITGWTMGWGTIHGTVSNAQTDDENYFYLESSDTGMGFSNIIGTFTVNIAPGYRDFRISTNMNRTDENSFSIKINGETWKSGTILDFNNELKEGVNEIGIVATGPEEHFFIYVYYFEAKDVYNEGDVKIVNSMNGMNNPVQISNNWDDEISMEREFPEGYETGNVSFSILRENVIDKNIVLITLSGTSGTLVLTLENNDLYNGTYASKDSLALNILKQDVWQEFVIFFNVSKGCQIFVDGVNTTMPDEYVTFSTGPPSDIDAFKIETKYTSGESYSFWFDNFLVSEIEGGFMLDVYNRFVFLDDLEYSFDEGAKKSFTDRELFSFPEDGLHNVTIYGTDFYGDEYRSEFTIFTTGSTCDFFIFSEANEMPTQWSDYSFTYGSAGGTGSTEYNDDIYAYMNAGTIAGSDTYLGSIIPNGNLISGWNEGDGGSHYDLLNEYPLSADGGNIRESGWNVNDRWDFSSLTIPDGAYVSKLEVNGWVMRQSGVYNAIMLTSNCFGGTQWWTPSNGYYSLKTRTITGLNIDQGELNSFYLNVHTLENEPPNGWVDIEYVYINVYYKPINYRFTAEITFTIPSTDLFSIDTFYYDYSLTDTSIYSELNIWNDDSSNWNTNLESDYDQSYTGYYDLTDPYISSSNQVKFQLFTNIQLADFDMRLDQFMITYIKRVKKEL